MRFVTDKIEWTKSMKDFAESTIEKKLDRLVSDFKNTDFKLNKINDNELKVEISLPPYRAQAIHEDFYGAVVEAEAKLKKIITRDKAQKSDVRQLSIFDYDESGNLKIDSDSVLISKEKTFELPPITVSEAIEQFNATDYPFYVYRDVNEDCIAVLYRRYGGSYGRIKCL